MLKISSFIMSVITLLGLMLPGVKYGFKPTVEVDCSAAAGEIKTYASGFLYGLATQGVPSKEMAESLDISSASQKTVGGLQHPVGDVDDVYKNLDSCDYIAVYLQDCFDSWYYCHTEIENMRKSGSYDCEKFVSENYLPKVEKQVKELSKREYADKLVYCIYNECDNAVWFGEEDENGNPQFNDGGRRNFYSAWKKTYELVKSVNPDARIGGPGYCDYDSEKLASFLDFCNENGCIPDVMIYHELNGASSAFFSDHVKEYRELEKKYNIELPVMVTEYGCMEECGNPGKMLPYICAMEESKVYGNVAFWRLANNLCDTAADDNSPNANWWLYRWYADLEGERLSTRVIDIMHSDVANVVKYNRDSFHYVPLNAVSVLNEDRDEITLIVGGSDYKSDIALKNLKDTELGGAEVSVKVECVYYRGLSGVVSSPVTVKEYTEKVGNKLKIKLDCDDRSSVYRISLTKAEASENEDFINEELPVRYEFEQGERLGDAYVYDSAYATTGLTEGMVGGMEKPGDGVSVEIDAPKDGTYNLDVIYGKNNDGQTPSDRTDAKVLFSVDGEEKTISLPNTVKSEFTSCVTLTADLKKGKHKISFKHSEETYVLDSMLVYPAREQSEISVLKDADRSDENTAAFLAVAPYDGYFEINITPKSEFLLDGIKASVNENGTAAVYLRRGLNYIEVKDKNCISCVIKTKVESAPQTVSAEAADFELSDNASLKSAGDIRYADGISSESGKAEFKINAENGGDYRMTLKYSNNREGSVHDYNVDLIECCLTVSVNGESFNVWCRNTMSDESFKTVTANIKLKKGENTIVLSNNGEFSFNGSVSFAPNIARIDFSPACVK